MAARILVINDTVDMLEAFRDVLEYEGYEVLLASIAPESIDDVERLKPDLIILDLVFGSERAGWQLLQKLRLRRATAMLPVIVCTAAIQYAREMEAQLIAHGARLVFKPFEIDEFLDAVRLSLGHTITSTSRSDDESPDAEGTSDEAPGEKGDEANGEADDEANGGDGGEAED